MNRSPAATCLAVLLTLAAPAAAQEAKAPPKDEPVAPKLFDGAPRDLAAQYPNVTVREIGKSRGGRPLALVSVVPKDASPADVEWEALVVAGLEGLRDRNES
jgi:hypothetical protein